MNTNKFRMPVVFSGHGSPMMVLDDTDVTRGFRTLGEEIIEKFGKPKAILAVSAHWYIRGTFIQSTEQPRQVYDMYGFPQELYEVKYPVEGCPVLSERVQVLLGNRVSVDDSWGIDHGTWTVLVHMFPDADIPVVQLSVDATLSMQEIYKIGQDIAALRDEGYLIFASGNVVHNLRRVEWDNNGGSTETDAFNENIIKLVEARDDASLMDYKKLEYSTYAVPSPEHYLPLIYMLGAAKGEKPRVFNNHTELGAISMTGFAFGI